MHQEPGAPSQYHQPLGIVFDLDVKAEQLQLVLDAVQRRPRGARLWRGGVQPDLYTAVDGVAYPNGGCVGEGTPADTVGDRSQ
ncbi:hypothetical protein GCM10009733_090940 [Nonomuraea maheshkhaliensis]|uniref:Uncharacterized protein n=1 Tax=Nonomuraea maheshkhaliensis TaxID=419590 RepID=A0ABN2H0K6_9ACTN